MKIASWIALSLTVLLVNVPKARADERADSILEQAEDAASAAIPVLADYTVTYTYNGNKWTDECRTIRANGTQYSTRRTYAQENTLPPNQLPRTVYGFDPLLSGGLPSAQDNMKTRYQGTITEGNSTYKLVEIWHTVTVQSRQAARVNFEQPLFPDTKAEVHEIWYIGTDEMIHRMRGDIKITHRDGPKEPQVVQIEASVTTIRKPRELHVDPQSRVKPERILDTESGSILAMAYSQDGKRLAFGYYEGDAEVWDTHTWIRLPFSVEHTGLVQGVAFSPDGKMLATASSDKTAKLCDATSGTVRHTLTHPSAVASVAFSPDGKHLATAAGKTIRIWNAATGTLEQTLTGHTDSIVNVAFSPDGKRLASCSFDNTAKLWDTTRWQVVANLVGHTSPVFSVSFSPDSQMLATTSRDGVVKLWDLATGRLLHTIQDEDGPIMAVAFTRDGKTLAASYDDKLRDEGGYHPGIKFWDTTTGRSLRTLTADNLGLTRLVISPDGSTLLTGGWSRVVQLFALPGR
jgi:WD40 repeat protein